ncbi:helix-turn-helix domain-containing protein [Microbacterium hominis]
MASAAGLDEGTLRRILAGERWPDVRTAALLEEALQKPLYPRWSMEWRV